MINVRCFKNVLRLSCCLYLLRCVNYTGVISMLERRAESSRHDSER